MFVVVFFSFAPVSDTFATAYIAAHFGGTPEAQVCVRRGEWEYDTVLSVPGTTPPISTNQT